jgi:hypothetical protein
MLRDHFSRRSGSGKSRYSLILAWIFLAVIGVMALPPYPASSLTSVPQDDYAMSPIRGPRGTQVEVTGTVADSNPVAVFWDDDVIVSCNPAPQRCRDPQNQDPHGFRVRFTVPSDATIGDHRVSLCASGICEGFDAAWTFRWSRRRLQASNRSNLPRSPPAVR